MVLIVFQVQILMVLPKQILMLKQKKSGESSDSEYDDLAGDDLNPDGAATIQIDLHKVGGSTWII